MDCSDCTNKTCLKTKKPCKEIEKQLLKDGIRSADWIRPIMPRQKRKDKRSYWREVPFSSLRGDDLSQEKKEEYGLND